MKLVLSIYIYFVVYICLIIYSEVVYISRIVIACFMIDWTVPCDKFKEILQRFVRRFFLCACVFRRRKGRRRRYSFDFGYFLFMSFVLFFKILIPFNV